MEVQPQSKDVSPLADVRLGIGTWAWGDRLFWGYGSGYSEAEVRGAFETSLENGIQFFDTAEVYGQGKSETLLGKFIRETQAKVKIASKYMPYPWRLTQKAFLRALVGSLARLGVDSIDLYQIHNPLPPARIEAWMDGMAEAYQRGWIKAVGVSNFTERQMQVAYEALARQGIPLASNQVEYSLLNREVEFSGLLQRCKDLNVVLIAYSPLAMGALTGKYNRDNPMGGMRGARYGRKLLQRSEPLLKEMLKIGSDRGGRSASQVALNWVMCKGALPIPGAKNARQAEQNAGALGWSLTDEEVARLDALSLRALKAD